MFNQNNKVEVLLNLQIFAYKLDGFMNLHLRFY